MNRIKYSIREAVINDLAEIRMLQAVSWLETYPCSDLGITRESIESIPWIQKALMGSPIKNQVINELTYVAINPSDEAIIGVIKSKEETNDKVWIKALYIHPKYTGGGIGSALLEKVLSHYPNQIICIEVATYNTRAINFYKKFGFVTDEKPHLFQIGTVSIPVLTLYHKK